MMTHFSGTLCDISGKHLLIVYLGKSSKSATKTIFWGFRFFESDISEVGFWLFWLMLPDLGPNR